MGVPTMNETTSADMDKSATSGAASTGHEEPLNSKKPNLVDELEDAVRSCFSGLIGPDYRLDQNIIDIRANVEPSLQQLLEVARQLEAHFVRRRYQMVKVRPAWFVTEEMNDMRAEIKRRDELLHNHRLKVQQWKQLLSQPPVAVQQHQAPPAGAAAAMMQHMLQQQQVQHGPGHILQYHHHRGAGAGQAVMSRGQHMPPHGDPPGMSPMYPHHMPPGQAPITSNVAQSIMFSPQPTGAGQHHVPMDGPLARLEQTTSNIGTSAPTSLPAAGGMHNIMHRGGMH